MMFFCNKHRRSSALTYAAAALSLLAHLTPLYEPRAFAWGVDGHHIINRLAGQSLPQDCPAFLRSQDGVDALTYYAPQPDHWRSPATPQLSAATAPEHFIQLESLDAILPTLPRERFDYVRALALVQARHPEQALTAERLGMQPYAAEEVYQRLTIGMRDYRELLAEKADTRPVEAEIVFLAGWLGHYVGDGSMPLHTSKYPNGWTGPNPRHYNEGHNIHGLFESQYVHANITAADILPLVSKQPTVVPDVFPQYMTYLRSAHSHVQEMYELDKVGAFTDAGTPAGKALVSRQLASAATELRDLIFTAWVRSGEPLPTTSR